MSTAISSGQREILEALASHWELLRWRCNDGSHRWHMGEGEMDGRVVRGLWLRGLVEIDMRGRLPQMVLTDAGRAAIAPGAAPGGHDLVIGGTEAMLAQAVTILGFMALVGVSVWLELRIGCCHRRADAHDDDAARSDGKGKGV